MDAFWIIDQDILADTGGSVCVARQKKYHIYDTGALLLQAKLGARSWKYLFYSIDL